MMSIRALLIAALIAVVPATDAVAQSRDRGDRDRYEQRDDRRGGQNRGDDRGGRRESQRANPGQVAREVQNGRPGRMLGIRERGNDYTVRWEYPGGRVDDIEVDGRSGRPR
jgi:Ni/Co efflux regulator RcnB